MGTEQATSFQELKDQLSQSRILGYFDPYAQTMVINDARYVGLGGALVQKKDLGVELSCMIAEL